jgi:hypothetical protein
MSVTPDARQATLERRLAELRGNAPGRSPSVRVLAAYSRHTDCRLATLAFSAGVDLDRLLAGTRFAPAFGQSPFAFARGLAFEESLRKDDYSALRALLQNGLSFPASPRILNLRKGSPKSAEGMSLRARETRDLLRRIIQGSPDAPHLIDGAVLRTTVGGRLAHFEADALAARGPDQIRVAEVKSFPKVDDRVDPDKLGPALDQAALYILLTREEVLDLGGDPQRLVSDLALVITPRNLGLQPTLSEQRVGARMRRLRRVLDGIPSAADVAAAAPAGLSFGPVSDTSTPEERRLISLHVLADTVGTAYGADCLSSCGNARFCRERAFKSGSPCLTGSAASRLIPGVESLHRAEELACGAAPKGDETPAAALLERAARLYDQAAPPPGTVDTRRQLA